MISVEVRNAEVLRKLQAVAAQFSAPRIEVINRKVSAELYGWVGKNFDSEGRMVQPQGWQKLALSTIMKRARKIRGKKNRATVRGLYRQYGAGGREQVGLALGGALMGRFPILQDDGELRQSFHGFSDQYVAGVGARVYVTKRKKRAPPEDLAAIHQEGRGKVPARPMLPTPAQGLEIAMRVYGNEVARIARGS